MHTAPPLRALLAPGIAQALIALDYSIMYVALPALSAQLHIGFASAQWIISLYGLTFSGLLLIGGWLCDRLGARRAFSHGLVLFLLMSVLGGIAQGETLLLLARGGQGVAAALMQPAILALIGQRFQGAAHRRALSIWSATGALGLVAGVVLGGVLVGFGWRWVFFINIPPGLLALALVLRHFAQQKILTSARAFSFGALLGSAAAASLVWALTRLAETGQADFLANRLSATLILLFVLHECVASRPLLSKALRALTTLRTGWLASACYMASVGSQFYVMTLLWQQHFQLDVLTTGLLFIPLAAMIVVGNAVFSRAAARYATQTLLTLGFTLSIIGLLALAYSVATPLSLPFILGIVLSGLGHGVIYPAMFSLGLQDVSTEQQGRASAVLVTSQYASGAIALAILTLLLGPAASLENWSHAFALLGGAAGLGLVVAINAR